MAPARFSLATVFLVGLAGIAPRAGADARPIHLRGATLEAADVDGRAAATSLPSAFVTSPFARGEVDLFLVQVTGDAGPAARRLVRAAGGEPLDVLPLDVLSCRLTRGAHDRLAASPAVARIVFYQPGWRVHPLLLEPELPELTVEVILARGADAEATRVVLKGDGAAVRPAPNVGDHRALVVTIPADRVAALAREAHVLWIEPHRPVERHLSVAHSSGDVPTARSDGPGPMIDAERAWARGLRGQGEVIAVADGGLDEGDVASVHPDFGELGSGTNPLRLVETFGPGDLVAGRDPGWEDRIDHGTGVAGAALGGGVASGARPEASSYAGSEAGIAPEAGLVVQALWDDDGFVPSLMGDWTEELFGPAHAVGARTWIGSWGAAAEGDYNANAARVDHAAWDLPDLTIAFSAGNGAHDGSLFPLPWGRGLRWFRGSCGTDDAWTMRTDHSDPACAFRPWVPGLPFWSATPDPCATPYAPGLSSCLISPLFRVYPARPPAELILLHDLDLADEGDVATAWVATDGTRGEVRVAEWRGPQQRLQQLERLPLPPAAWGESARVRFELTTDGAGAGRGWSVYWVSLPDGITDGDMVESPATAKSALGVGASETYRPGGAWDAEMPGDCATPAERAGVPPQEGDDRADDARGIASFSERGPASDGRVKPDLVAPSVFLLTPRNRSQSPESAAWNNCGIPDELVDDYRWFSGTSAAAPQVAGAAALARQLYREGRHANGTVTTLDAPAPEAAFEPTSALVRATLLNGAHPLHPGQFPSPGPGVPDEVPPEVPNPVAGFGRVDVAASLLPSEGHGVSEARRTLVEDVGAGLRTGDSRTHRFEVVDARDELRVTLAWTDAPGRPAGGRALVNDLDLLVRTPDGRELRSGGSPTPNEVDPMEHVVVPPAELVLGDFEVTVSGTRVPGQVDVAGSERQPYALVVSGGIDCALPRAIGATLRVAREGDDALLRWEAPSGEPASSFEVATFGRIDDFVVPTVVGESEVVSWTHADVIGDGRATYWRVAAVNRCGRASDWR